MKISWYNFVFYGRRLDNGMTSFCNTYVGYEYGIPDLDLQTLERLRFSAGVHVDATFISFQKLGYMTEAEFKKNTDQEIL